MRTWITLLGTAAIGLAVSLPAHANPEANMKTAGCFACHTVDKKLVGPSYKDVAAKYKGQADAVAKLTEKSRNGGKGVWGQIPMPPNPVAKISDADLKAAVEWILKQ
ncbi:MAG: c-type cytochrome [Betaproteobacteria bacterium]|jgi:cytochrome c|nr:c-type cytochrome [Betaproteobacteria bacterium]MBK7457301.1 c-type cytochrome [Betaproteobacteria bacterium]MBK7517978.1 c-type cytochrome [Betaproteobacteria bacterium]MBK8104547.1 c-type cytochrome [Betaproteobacteria bacterium]